jgi:repressor LexA
MDGKFLRQRRKQLGLTLDDVAVIVGVGKSTVRKWESGEISEMGRSNIAGLAKALRISPLLILGDSDFEPPEEELLPEKIQHIVTTCARLNDEGQQIVSNTADGLDASGQYRREEPLPLITLERQQIYTIGTAAAGSGFLNGDALQNYRVIMTTQVPKHDFSIDVKGDSMFPTLYDGDIAFCRKNFVRKNDHIYVLDIDGEVVIKRVRFSHNLITLISDNPDWPDRDVTGFELESTRIEGEVIGWETPI